MPSELSRRSVLKTTAWSVPVLALAVAAPLASASGVPVAILTAVCLQNIEFRISATSVGIPAGIVITFTSSTIDLTTLTFPTSLAPLSVTSSSASLTYGLALTTTPAPIDITGTSFPNTVYHISAAVTGFGGDTASLSFDQANSTCLAN